MDLGSPLPAPGGLVPWNRTQNSHFFQWRKAFLGWTTILYILFVSNSRNVLDAWAIGAICCISWDLNFTSHWVPKDWGSIWFAWVWCFNIQHWHLSNFVDFLRDPLKSHSFIAQNQVSIPRIHHCQGYRSPIGKGLRSASHGVRT